MPDDINKRMNYFDRQFLRAADYKVEQEYHLHRHRLHNKLLHTPGVATQNDLNVTGDSGQNTLTVAAGIAIDVDGREKLHSSSTSTPSSSSNATRQVQSTVRLSKDQSDPSSDPGVDGRTRIKEEHGFLNYWHLIWLSRLCLGWQQ